MDSGGLLYQKKEEKGLGVPMLLLVA